MNSKKVLVITDSSASLPESLRQELDIHVIPLWLIWDNDSFRDGVDINPLAVELACLSLWILSMAKDNPLSFLNHHLKCGNSLVGVRLKDVGRYPFTKKDAEVIQLDLFTQNKNFNYIRTHFF